jgi:hypothetical protein
MVAHPLRKNFDFEKPGRRAGPEPLSEVTISL